MRVRVQELSQLEVHRLPISPGGIALAMLLERTLM